MRFATVTARPRLRLARCFFASVGLLWACEAAPTARRDPEPEPEMELIDPAAEPLAPELATQVATHLADYGRHWPAFRFHGSVIVARGDEVGVDQAFGFADLVEGVPNESDTMFRIGTLSAQLTAAAVLRLAAADRLRLDDPVSRYLPYWPNGERITLEHLLSHRSGIPNYTDMQSFEAWKRQEHTLQTAASWFRNLPLEFDPGTDTSPSNSNYMLLGLVLESITGQPHHEVVAEQVLEPLGMHRTQFADTEHAQAVGMEYHEDERLVLVADVEPSAFGSAGGWLSTTGDLLRWVRGLNDEQFLPSSLVERMQGRGSEGFGYAWTDSEIAGRDALTWPGLIDGFNASLVHVPSDDTTIIVLSNSEVLPTGQLVGEIASLIYEGELPKRVEARAVPVEMEEQRRAKGRYVLTRGTEQALEGADPEAMVQLAEIRVVEQEGVMVLDIPIHGRKRMHPAGAGRFFFKDGGQSTAQFIERGEKAALLVLEANGSELRYVRIAEDGVAGA
ncbi:MAG: serine hydrolase domain-containing protein [Myxococcota bacterium]